AVGAHLPDPEQPAIAVAAAADDARVRRDELVRLDMRVEAGTRLHDDVEGRHPAILARWAEQGEDLAEGWGLPVLDNGEWSRPSSLAATNIGRGGGPDTWMGGHCARGWLTIAGMNERTATWAFHGTIEKGRIIMYRRMGILSFSSPGHFYPLT